jgi:hypothetical protein
MSLCIVIKYSIGEQSSKDVVQTPTAYAVYLCALDLDMDEIIL